jgi:hypothetical protein
MIRAGGNTSTLTIVPDPISQDCQNNYSIILPCKWPHLVSCGLCDSDTGSEHGSGTEVMILQGPSRTARSSAHTVVQLRFRWPGNVTSQSWDTDQRRRTLTGADAIRVRRLMGRSGCCSPCRSHGKRFLAAPEARLDNLALAVRPARRTTRRFAPAAARHPKRPIKLCRRSSASDIFFGPPLTV